LATPCEVAIIPMALPCHEPPLLSSPTARWEWTRIFFDCAHATAATRLSGSVALAIAGSDIAVHSAEPQPGGNSSAKPNRRHQQSPEGRLDHRDRQRAATNICHRGLRHRNSQLQQFAVNPRCAPQGISLAHAPNEITNVCRDFWPSRKGARFSGPMPGESSAVPT